MAAVVVGCRCGDNGRTTPNFFTLFRNSVNWVPIHGCDPSADEVDPRMGLNSRARGSYRRCAYASLNHMSHL